MIRKILGILAFSASLGGCVLEQQVNDLKDLKKAAKDLSSLSVLITDNLAGTYAEVWVSVLSLEAVGANGQVVSFFSNPDGRVFNVASLNGAAELLNATEVPSGAYKSFSLTLARNVTVVDAQGNTRQLPLPGSGVDVTLQISGNVVVAAGAIKSFALDFDLSQFLVDNQGILQPVVNLVDVPSSLITATVARLDGTVVSVDAANGTFTFQPVSGGPTLTARLHASSSVTNEQTLVTAGIDLLAPNVTVSLYGRFDPSSFSVEALNVKINGTPPKGGNATDAIGQVVEVEGMIESFDGDVARLDVHEASFIPGDNVIEIIDLANAYFSRGSLALLQAGQTIEVKGFWNGANLTARVVEIEGASATTAHHGYVGAVGEVDGTVASIAGTQLTINVTAASDATLTGPTLTVDVSDAWFKHGALECVAPGMAIEMRGELTGQTFVPNIIELEGACSVGVADNAESDDSASNSGSDTHDDDH